MKSDKELEPGELNQVLEDFVTRMNDPNAGRDHWRVRISIVECSKEADYEDDIVWLAGHDSKDAAKRQFDRLVKHGQEATTRTEHTVEGESVS